MKQITTVFLLIFFFVLTHFLYEAIITKPVELDSVYYHIPVAHALLSGSYFSSKTITPTDGLTYQTSYPVLPEMILAVFSFMKLPLNLFNVLSYILFFVALIKLGKAAGLTREISLIFAVSVCLLPTVVRLPLTQTSDIWLDIFFTSSLLLLLKKKRSDVDIFYLGCVLGCMMASKYSGPLYVIALLVVFGKKLLTEFTYKRLSLLSIPVMIVGLSWYIKNLILFGSPFYPAGFLWFRGDPTLYTVVWPHIKTLVSSAKGFSQTITAFISEYLLWTLSFICVPLYLFSVRNRNKGLIDSIRLLFFLGALNLVVYFILPGYPFDYSNIVSEIRYGHPAAIAFILITFLIAMKMKKEETISYISLVLIITALTFIPFRPKIVILYAVLIAVFLIWRVLLFQRFNSGKRAFFNKFKHRSSARRNV